MPVQSTQLTPVPPPSSTPAAGSHTTQGSVAAAPNQPLNNGAVPVPTAAGAALALSNGPVSSPPRRSRSGFWTDFWSPSNGLGISAFIMAPVFGVGAWVGMNMQYHQGAKSLELSIWTTCADHEVRRNGVKASISSYHRLTASLEYTKFDVMPLTLSKEL